MEPDVAKKRGVIRRMYDWVLSWADTPYGTPALFIISFMESSFFPIPPDVLQIALSAGKPRRAFWYATVTLLGSITGAFLGYLIGYAVWEATQGFFYAAHLFSEENFRRVKELYQEYGFWAVLISAPTPIPYKIFTIAAGVCELALLPFFIASVLGRGARFYLVAAIMYFFGPTVKSWIEKYFELFMTLFGVLLVGGFLVIKFLI
ncbi:MAG: DedA family protein [Planctomycetaceae bacterium]|nr:DedA family protein [Planctomycetaceae bacterium]